MQTVAETPQMANADLCISVADMAIGNRQETVEEVEEAKKAQEEPLTKEWPASKSSGESVKFRPFATLQRTEKIKVGDCFVLFFELRILNNFSCSSIAASPNQRETAWSCRHPNSSIRAIGTSNSCLPSYFCRWNLFGNGIRREDSACPFTSRSSNWGWAENSESHKTDSNSSNGQTTFTVGWANVSNNNDGICASGGTPSVSGASGWIGSNTAGQQGVLGGIAPAIEWSVQGNLV